MGYCFNRFCKLGVLLYNAFDRNKQFIKEPFLFGRKSIKYFVNSGHKAAQIIFLYALLYLINTNSSQAPGYIVIIGVPIQYYFQLTATPNSIIIWYSRWSTEGRQNAAERGVGGGLRTSGIVIFCEKQYQGNKNQQDLLEPQQHSAQRQVSNKLAADRCFSTNLSVASLRQVSQFVIQRNFN